MYGLHIEFLHDSSDNRLCKPHSQMGRSGEGTDGGAEERGNLYVKATRVCIAPKGMVIEPFSLMFVGN